MTCNRLSIHDHDDRSKQMRIWLTHGEMGTSGGETVGTLRKRGRSREFRRDHRVVGASQLDLF